MSTIKSHERFAITATGPSGDPVPVAYHVRYSNSFDNEERTALILPHQRRSFVRQYGHEEGWTIAFEALLEVPEELVLSWAHMQLREWVSKDNVNKFDEIAVGAIMAYQHSDELS